MTNLIIPRNIREMAGLFEDLLFMRTEKFIAGNSGDRSFSLTHDGIALLGTLGITGRIFRRWYQTTWGFQSFSQWFSGETPRMELARRYTGLHDGDAYIGVELVQNEAGDVKVMPSVYEKKEIDAAGGIFAMGRNSLPAHAAERRRFHRLPAPNFDPEFKSFTVMLEEAKKDMVREKIEPFSANAEERAWKIFWPDACVTLLLNCGIKRPRHELVVVSAIMRGVIESFIKEQSAQTDNYISIDHLFSIIWDLFCQFDSRLLPLKECMGKDNKAISDLMMRENGPYSLGVYYSFSNLFDELFLFPADRYFGAVECVWTDKSSFANDLAVSVSLLNNNLKLPPFKGKLSAAQKKFQQETGIEEKVSDIYLLWFSPPTCFRVLPRFLAYFK